MVVNIIFINIIKSDLVKVFICINIIFILMYWYSSGVNRNISGIM